MKRSITWGVVLIVILAVGIGLAIGMKNIKKRMASAPEWHPRPVPVDTAEVTLGVLRQTLRYLARLEALATAEITPRISARITEVKVDEGDVVANGELLARLDDRDIQAQISSIQARIEAQKAGLKGNRASLTAARQNLEYLKREYERDRQLFENKGISRSDMEASQNRLNNAQGDEQKLEEQAESIEQEIKSLEAQLEEARTRLSYTVVTSPYPGRIRRRFSEVGDMAKPGAPLFSMMDVSSYRLEFDLVQEDLTRIRPGQAVRIHWPAEIQVPPDRQQGELARIFPSMESDKTVRAEIDLQCRCPEKIKIGSLVPLEVVIREGTGLIVPKTALVPIPEGGQAVYAVREGRLKRVPVIVDFSGGEHSLIQGDIEPGERVAVGEYLQWVRLHEGMSVEVQS